MKYLLLSLLLAFGSPVGLQAQSQAEMNAEALEDLRRADDKLNEVYRALLRERSAEKEFCHNLREAQRAWLKFVDFQLHCLFPLRKGEVPTQKYGSVFPLEWATAKQQLMEKRIRDLEYLRQWPDSPED